MDSGREYVSCVTGAISALRDGHNEVVTKQVADNLLAASSKTLETITAMENNHKAVIKALNTRISTYETTIRQLMEGSAKAVKEATAECFERDVEGVAAMVTGLVQIGLKGIKGGSSSGGVAIASKKGGEEDPLLLMSEENSESGDNEKKASPTSPTTAAGNDDGLNDDRPTADADADDEEEVASPTAESVTSPFSDDGAANDEDDSTDDVIASISDWFKKSTAESKKTINNLSYALSTVTAEREQFRTQVALLKATTVPAHDHAVATARIATLEGELLTANTNALALSAELTQSVTKGLADHAAEKAALTSQIAALTAEIETFKKMEQNANDANSNAAKIHGKTLNEALAEAERCAIDAATAKAQLESLPTITHQLELAKRSIATFEATSKAQTARFEALQKEMNATLYQNAVLTQQLAESLCQNAQIAAADAAKTAVAKAKGVVAGAGTAAGSQSSSSTARRWLFLSGAQQGTGNATAISTAAASSSASGIGMKSAVRRDDNNTPYTARNTLVNSGLDTNSIPVRSLQPSQSAALTDVVSFAGATLSSTGTLSGAGASVVASAVDRFIAERKPSATAKCCFGGAGAAVGVSDDSSNSDSDATSSPYASAEARVAVQLAGYSVSDVSALVQQNSLLVALLFEQRQYWGDVTLGLQSLFEGKKSSRRELDMFEQMLQSSTSVSLAQLAAYCREEAVATSAGAASAAKKLRTEEVQRRRSTFSSAESLVNFERSVCGVIASSMDYKQQSTTTTTDDDGMAEDDMAMPDLNAIIYGGDNAAMAANNGNTRWAAGHSCTSSLESYADIKRELRKLLALGSGVADVAVVEKQHIGENDDNEDEDALTAAGYIIIDDHTFMKNSKVFVSEGTNPDYAALAAEEQKEAVKQQQAQHAARIAATASSANTIAVNSVCNAMRARVDALSTASVSLTTAWSEMFASNNNSADADDENGSSTSFKSVTTITVNALKESLAAYATLCTELDCEVSVLRAKMGAYEQQIVALEDAVAISSANDVSNYNALQLMGDYLLQCITKVSSSASASTATVATQQSTAATVPAATFGGFAVGASASSASAGGSGANLDPNTIAIMTTFANVVDVINATLTREETLADVFVRACSAFHSNPALASHLEKLNKKQKGGGNSSDSAADDADNSNDDALVLTPAEHIAPLCTTLTTTKCTFGSWRSFTSNNTAVGATSKVVEEELRTALEAEKARADYFQELFESAAAQREEWIEHLFTTDQKCRDAEVQLSETQSTMITTDEHTRVLFELESALARKSTADELIEALQASVNARDADIARLNAKLQQVEAQMMKNDADHRTYEQTIQAQLASVNRAVSERDGALSQLRSVLVQTQAQVTVEKTTVIRLNERIVEFEASLNTMRHETIEEAYRSGILHTMFPTSEQAVAVALEAAENKRIEALGRNAELEALRASLARTELLLQESEAVRTAESAKRQRLELLLSESEETVKGYYDNVEEAISALKIKCDSLDRQLSSVTRERDATLAREEALQSQLEVLGADPTTENVRRYGLAATRIFEVQMSELHDRFLTTQVSLGETQNALATTKADLDARVTHLTAEKAAYAEALEKQQSIVQRVADDKDAIAADLNALQNKHQQLEFDAANERAVSDALKRSEAALQQMNKDTKAMVESLRADNKQLLGVTGDLKETNGKLQNQLEATKRVAEQFKTANDDLRTRIAQSSAAAASAAANAANMARGRPQHRLMQSQPPF